MKKKNKQWNGVLSHIFPTEITKNGYTRSSNNHFRVKRKLRTRTPPGRPLIGRTTVVPGSGSEQSGCTRCVKLMFRSTRYWLPLYPELVRSVQATRRRAHTQTRQRVHTRPTLRIRISAARQIFRYFRAIMRRISPPGALYVRTRRTYACRIQHRLPLFTDDLLYVIVDNQVPHTYGEPIVVGHLCFTMSILQPPMPFSGER